VDGSHHEDMSNRTKYILGGAAIAFIGWLILPKWLALVLILAVVAAPVAGYLLLDESQRRRLHRLRHRGQLPH
jgi:hypothetical protein